MTDKREEKRRSEARRAGQGAREKSNELAAKSPIKTFFSKLTLDIIPTEENAWRIGAETEEEVGELLAGLPSYWTVRHDILLRPNWNVDHIVVGPPGVFVLDTKFRSGEVRSSRGGIRVDGYRTNMAEKVQEQAREVFARLKRAGLRAWVQPVLVFDAESISGRAEPDGVHVVGIEELVEYLRTLPRDLDATMVDRIGAAVRDDATWLLAP